MLILLQLIVALSMAPIVTHAITAQKLPVFQLPFYDKGYPFNIALTIRNTTSEPIFFVTRHFNGNGDEPVIVEPFESVKYEVTIPSLYEIKKTWILFSFNEDTLREFSSRINTNRKTAHIIRSQKGALGIVTLERQKRMKPTIRVLTINELDLQEKGAWELGE